MGVSLTPFDLMLVIVILVLLIEVIRLRWKVRDTNALRNQIAKLEAHDYVLNSSVDELITRANERTRSRSQ